MLQNPNITGSPTPEGPAPAELRTQVARAWDEVAGLVPGTLVTEEEASAYVAGTLSPERLEELERLLSETPGYAAALRTARRDFAAFYTPERWAQAEARFAESEPNRERAAEEPARATQSHG